MTLSTKWPLLSCCLICLLGCKKGESPQNSKPDTQQPGLSKSIEVVKGNNQAGYSGKMLDTIIVQVNFEANAQPPSLSYFFNNKNDRDIMYVVEQKELSGALIIKILWQPSGAFLNPTMTFYTHQKCSTTQISQGGCNTLDSVKLSATIRQPWKSVFEGEGGGSNILHDLTFTDDLRGIAVGEWSGIVTTTDGGNTWLAGPSAGLDNDAYLISFTGRDTALVNISNNYTYFTYDGGKTFLQPRWSPPFIGDRSSSAYLLKSRKIIYSVGWNANIAKTTDGGEHWTIFNGLNSLNTLNDIIAVGKDTLYTCGQAGLIVKSTDAGATWKQQPVKLKNDLHKIYFLTNIYGFAAGQDGALIRTTDGGEHWQSVFTGLRFTIIAVRFFSPLHGFVVSYNGEVAESTDGGLNWILKNKGSYGVNTLLKAVIKDEHTVYGLEHSSIYSYDLTQK